MAEEQSAPARTPRTFAEHLTSSTIEISYLIDPPDTSKTYHVNRSILSKVSPLLNTLLNSPNASTIDDSIISLQKNAEGIEYLAISSYDTEDAEDLEIKQAAFECFLQYAYLHMYSLVELDKTDLGKRLLLQTHIYIIARRLQAGGLLQRSSDGVMDILLERMEEDIDPLQFMTALDLLFANTQAGLTRKAPLVKLPTNKGGKSPTKRRAQPQRSWTEYDSLDLLMRQAFAAHAHHKLRDSNDPILIEDDGEDSKDDSNDEGPKPPTILKRDLYIDALVENSDLAVIVALHDFSSLFSSTTDTQTTSDATPGTPSWADLFEYISTFQFRHTDIADISVEVEFMLQQLPPGRFTKDSHFIPANSTTPLTPSQYEQIYYREYPKPAELKMIWNALRGYTRKQLAEMANEREEAGFWEALEHFPEGRFIFTPRKTVFAPMDVESGHQMTLEEYESYYEIPFPDETMLLALWIHNQGYTRKPKQLIGYDGVDSGEAKEKDEGEEDDGEEDEEADQKGWSIEEAIAGRKETGLGDTQDNTDASSTITNESDDTIRPNTTDIKDTKFPLSGETMILKLRHDLVTLREWLEAPTSKIATGQRAVLKAKSNVLLGLHKDAMNFQEVVAMRTLVKEIEACKTMADSKASGSAAAASSIHTAAPSSSSTSSPSTVRSTQTPINPAPAPTSGKPVAASAKSLFPTIPAKPLFSNVPAAPPLESAAKPTAAIPAIEVKEAPQGPPVVYVTFPPRTASTSPAHPTLFKTPAASTSSAAARTPSTAPPTTLPEAAPNKEVEQVIYTPTASTSSVVSETEDEGDGAKTPRPTLA